jgi:hypothetical protein
MDHAAGILQMEPTWVLQTLQGDTSDQKEEQELTNHSHSTSRSPMQTLVPILLRRGPYRQYR